MNLHELRTPHPLQDADFAAIRARVKAEIAQREERPWLGMLLRLAFAAGLFVIVVPAKDRVPNVPVKITQRVAAPIHVVDRGAGAPPAVPPPPRRRHAAATVVRWRSGTP